MKEKPNSVRMLGGIFLAAWYEESFGQDYLLVYKHRDIQGAQAEVKRMVNWLDLNEGSRIFDLCCGMGRHSVALADEGYRVTGMDLSKVLLEEARRLDDSGRITWLEGDMRQVPASGPFDAVVNLFTSFGYFEEDAENAKVLAEISRILKPGGRFIIDFLNPDYVVNNLVPHSVRQDEGITIDETRTIEDGFVRKRIVLSEQDRPERGYLEQVKLYGLEDFRRLSEGTGLVIEQAYGHYDGSPYIAEISQRLIMTGRKEEAQ
jgi:SAM-dependent methyltransferase